jgi:predicted O-methyltransferase YrrM
MAESAGTDVASSTPELAAEPPKMEEISEPSKAKDDLAAEPPKAEEIAEPPKVKEIADLTGLFAVIAATRESGAWTSIEKCQALAAMIVAQRSKHVVEIGVWEGGSLIPQLLALKHLGSGVGVAIDAWSAMASIEGQTDPANVEWWGRQWPHDQAYGKFISRLAQFGLTDICRVLRSRSDDVDVAALVAAYGEIDLLHCDSNHGDTVIREVERFGRVVSLGGLLVMDDLGWSGGSVLRARDRAIDLGFVQRYLLGTGCVLQRVRA